MPVAASDAQIRELAAQILSRPEYADWHAATASRLEELVREIGHWFQRWMSFTADLALHRPVLYWLLLGGLLLVIVLLLAHVIWSIRAALGARVPEGEKREAEVSSDFAGEADRLAASGRFLEAAHRLQLASIDLLLQRRVLELSRSDPNRTLRQRLRRAALPETERQVLLDLLRRLEQQWFRDRRDDRDLYDAWRALHLRLDALPQAA